MNGEISLKDLKALLDDNSIDLSMRELVSIPAKPLSKIPRATNLDFSNNLITSIPIDFCWLTHITKLDLSNNHIVHLPEEFGQLTNLVHLDLYKNEIEELPLSFGELISLKWLDLKGNPLEIELSQAAGDCLDEKGCKTAALNVVRLMRYRYAKQHQLLEKQKFVKKQSEDSDAVIHGSTIQKEKTKKKKNKHRDLVYEHLGPAAEHAQQGGSRTVLRKNEKSNHEMKSSGKRNRLVISIWRKIFTILFVFTLVMSILAVVVVLSSCIGEPRRWFLSSKPFCEDLETLVKKHSFPSTISGNFFLSITSLLKLYLNAASEVWKELEQKYDLLYMKLVSVGLLVQGYAMYKYDNFMAFYNAHVADAVNSAGKNIWLLLRIFGLMIADLLMLIVGESFFFVSSVVETIFTYVYRDDHSAGLVEQDVER
ncbi:unnamed protein product [Cercopithifilaria johnstoni]|uniref:Leucine-rich repeat-containing protein 59 n=1 Tax=Cercopithifilaria johnstoni TaxID=2874296 RepID=A0A8J2LWL7_9BILA|nr:unnamed protein product [Cercopithifilaria johnstoni]